MGDAAAASVDARGPPADRVMGADSLITMLVRLVRHGRTAANVGMLLDTAAPGMPLDEVGLEQAEALVERLAGVQVDAVYVSDLPRTHQTAAPLASALGIEPVELGGLREIQAGEDEMSPDWARYVGVLRAWGTGDLSAQVPGGETAHEFVSRFEDAVAAIADAGHESVVLVSHGAAIRCWVGHVAPEFHQRLGPKGLPNTSVITLEGDPASGWTLLDVDLPDH